MRRGRRYVRRRRFYRRRRGGDSGKKKFYSDAFQGSCSLTPRAAIVAGNAWHKRCVGWAGVCVGGDAELHITGGDIISFLSGNADNVPIRIRYVAIWGSQSTQRVACQFHHKEFMQNPIVDSLGYNSMGGGATLPRVMIKIPYHQQLVRKDWVHGTMTPIATFKTYGPGAYSVRVGLSFMF